MSKLLLVLVALGAYASVNAAELPRYQALDIGTLGGKNSVGLAINEAGQVTGYADTADGNIHAFLYSNGRMINLGTFGGRTSTGLDINEAGQVTGFALNADGVGQAFLYADGTMVNLGGLPGGDRSDGRAINESGEIAGGSRIGLSFHAVIYKNGEVLDLGTLGGSRSQALEINDAGDVVGNYSRIEGTNEFLRPFIYRDGALLDLGSLGGGDSFALDLNEMGQVVGWSQTEDSIFSFSHAFLYSDGGMVDLGTLGGNAGVANALNDAGDVVGHSTTEDGATHAFLFSQGLMVDLGAMLSENVSVAYDINNRGQVVGQAIRADGSGYAFVYTEGEVRNVNEVVVGLFPRPRRPRVPIEIGDKLNERGQILAQANFFDKRRHAVLLTPISLLFQKLITRVIRTNLDESPLKKVRESFSHYSAGRKPGTCSKLQAFILQVESLQHTSISSARARDLVLRAHAIRQAVGCS